MNSFSPNVAKKFCELCNWAYFCWTTHKRLFDKNERKEETIDKAKNFFHTLLVITQEYSLLQICKLHDHAKQGKSSNITIEYIEQFGEWGSDKENIKKIVSRLSDLFEKIKPARDKVIAHNDFETLTGETTLGAFPDGLDEKYFEALRELVDTVRKKWIDGPDLRDNFVTPFGKFTDADVNEFLNVLERSK